MKKKYLLKIVLTGILIALNVIMERFMSYNVWNMSIGFSFITVGFAASILGIPYAIAVAAFGDLIGALLFPFGAYRPPRPCQGGCRRDGRTSRRSLR